MVHEERRLQDIWDRRMPLIAEGGAWDPNRDTGQLPEGTPFKAVVDPLAYLVGRVEVVYGGDPSKSTAIDLASYIDPETKHVQEHHGRDRDRLGSWDLPRRHSQGPGGGRYAG